MEIEKGKEWLRFYQRHIVYEREGNGERHSRQAALTPAEANAAQARGRDGKATDAEHRQYFVSK